MQKIEGVELIDLVEKAARDIIFRNQEEAVTLIKKQLHKIAGLSEEIKKLGNEQKKKQEQLDKALGIIEKLKQGDWNVLQDEKQQGNKSGNTANVA